MTTLAVPKWLQQRLRTPAQPKPKTLSKKDRQFLPTLPNAKPPSLLVHDAQRPPGHQLRGLT